MINSNFLCLSGRLGLEVLIMTWFGGIDNAWDGKGPGIEFDRTFLSNGTYCISKKYVGLVLSAYVLSA